jgi:DNA-binding transcriptional MerR regulator
MLNKKYKSIDDVSKLLDLHKHVIRYWDSKFDGISTRLNSRKQRFFNFENINKIKKLKKILHKDGRHVYSLDLAKKLLDNNKKTIQTNEDISDQKIHNSKNNVNFIDINILKKISYSLKKLKDL